MDTRRGVIFFNAGPKHGVHLAVAVATLRSHYAGPIALITEQSGKGRETCELVASDSRLAPITVIADVRARAGSHGVSYCSKTSLPRLSPFDATIFLDADTIVAGDISAVWPDEASGEVVLTRFSDWKSRGGKMRNRIIPWGDRIVDEQTGALVYQADAQQIERVRVMLSKDWPAINTGVMGWSRNSEPFCDEWHRVTKMRNTFIVDETACQIIYPEFPHRIMDDRWNCSIIYPPEGRDVLNRPDAIIWHGHGGKFWKRPQGQHYFLPVYERCLFDNFGNIRAIAPWPKWWRWIPDNDRQRLKRYLHSAVAEVC